MPKSGFTLVELLVVVAIIAILAGIGLVSYQNITRNARDVAIKADLNAIKKAYEANYDPAGNNYQGGYQKLTDSMFASGKIPTQPDGSAYTCFIGPDNAPSSGVYGCIVPNRSDGYKVTVSTPLSDNTTPIVISNQGTLKVSGGLNTALVSDTFTKADSSSTMGTADSGQIWSTIGTWGISSNQGYCVSGNTGGGPYYATIDAGASDIDMSFFLNANGNAGGIATGTFFRYADTSNYMLVSMEDASGGGRTGKVKLNKVVGGAATQLGIYDPNLSSGVVTATIRVVAIGSNIYVYRNGTLIITASSGGSNNANTIVGLRQEGASPGNTNRWDNFTVNKI